MNYNINDLSRDIYNGLNLKGANLGNISILIIEKILNENLWKLKKIAELEEGNKPLDVISTVTSNYNVIFKKEEE